MLNTKTRIKKGCIVIIVLVLLWTSIVSAETLREKTQREEQTSAEAPLAADADWNYWTLTPHMFLIPKGNVGIGIKTPREKLDVIGTIRMTGFFMAINSSAGYVLTSDEIGKGTWQPLPRKIDGQGTANTVPKFSDSDTLTDSTIIEKDGNIGIGVNEPQRTLHLSSAMRLEPQTHAPPDGHIGDIFMGSDGYLYLHTGAGWRRVLLEGEQPRQPILWNTLGSVEEVEHSNIGVNGTIVNEGVSFVPGRYGNGFSPNWYSGHVQFPGVLEDIRETGTIELWCDVLDAYIRYIWSSIDEQFPGQSSANFRYTGSGGGLTFTMNGVSLTAPEHDWRGKWVHLAFVWDINGIDGTNDTMRIYYNNTLIGSTTTPFPVQQIQGLALGIRPDFSNADYEYLDNVKVWNYAKTSFVDSCFE